MTGAGLVSSVSSSASVRLRFGAMVAGRRARCEFADRRRRLRGRRVDVDSGAGAGCTRCANGQTPGEGAACVRRWLRPFASFELSWRASLHDAQLQQRQCVNSRHKIRAAFIVRRSFVRCSGSRARSLSVAHHLLGSASGARSRSVISRLLRLISLRLRGHPHSRGGWPRRRAPGCGWP